MSFGVVVPAPCPSPPAPSPLVSPALVASTPGHLFYRFTTSVLVDVTILVITVSESKTPDVLFLQFAFGPVSRRIVKRNVPRWRGPNTIPAGVMGLVKTATVAVFSKRILCVSTPPRRTSSRIFFSLSSPYSNNPNHPRECDFRLLHGIDAATRLVGWRRPRHCRQ